MVHVTGSVVHESAPAPNTQVNNVLLSPLRTSSSNGGRRFGQAHALRVNVAVYILGHCYSFPAFTGLASALICSLVLDENCT